jgi:hypothetical protein
MSIKHISEMKPTQRAKADEAIRECLLAIVVAQGKPVVIPIDQLDQIAADHRLVVSVNPKTNLVTLTAESHAAEIVKGAQRLAPVTVTGPADGTFTGKIKPN